jgi:hypothetical protein
VSKLLHVTWAIKGGQRFLYTNIHINPHHARFEFLFDSHSYKDDINPSTIIFVSSLPSLSPLLQTRRSIDTSDVIMPSRTSPSSDLSASGPSKPWRGTAPEPDFDEDMNSDVDENNASLVHDEPRRLDDSWSYAFQVNIHYFISATKAPH